MKKYNIPFSPPDISEEEINEVIDTLKSGWITTGPKTKELERRLSEFTNTPKTVCLNSATAALELTLRVLGIGEGDEVIVPAMTYTASCSVIYHVGAKAVIVDVAEDSHEMDYGALANAITENTKAVIPVDLAGIPCDYDKIFEVVESKKHLFKANSEYQEKLGRVAVVADGAHALGSTYKGKKIGSVADFTTFSFHAVKNFTTAEGGSVTWKENENFDNEELYREYQIYSLHGQTKDALAKTKAGSWEYDIVIPGYKCNLTDIAASIGTRITVLSHNSDSYKSCGHLYITHVEGATFEQRGEIIVKMAERGISCNVHYKPLPLLTAYKNLGFDIENYPNAYNYYVKEITLPLHTRLSDEDVAVIISNFKEIVEEVVGE